MSDLPAKRIKIAMLAPFGVRPKGTLIARMLPLAVELEKQGHSVVIIAPPYTNPEDSGSVETVEGVRVVNIRLSPLGITFAAPLLAWRMYCAMRQESPDIVHLFKPKGYGGLAAMFMCVLRVMGGNVPTFFVDTDDWEGKGGMNDLQDYPFLAKWLYAFQEKWLPRWADGVTVASRALNERVRAFGVPDDKVHYLPNGTVEKTVPDGMRVRRELHLSDETPVVLLYTRFFEFSQGVLYAVLKGIATEMPHVRFLVVGKGRFGEDDRLTEAAAAHGFSANLLQVGWVDPDQLDDYLAAADVAIYPFSDTLLNRCKCPAKLVQIIRNGMPVVADGVGQIREYLRDGRGGVLCEPGDANSMYRAVVGLLRDKARREAMGKEGRRYLLENFTWDKLTKEMCEFYNDSVKI